MSLLAVTRDLQLAALEDDAGFSEGFRFMLRYWIWLRNTYPDVYRAIRSPDGTRIPQAP